MIDDRWRPSGEEQLFDSLFDRLPEAGALIERSEHESLDPIGGGDAMFLLARELLPRQDDPCRRLLVFAEDILASQEEDDFGYADAVVGRLVLQPELRNQALPPLVEAAVQAELTEHEGLAAFVGFVQAVWAAVPELVPVFEQAFFLRTASS
jgi:hypothetical protein